MVELKLQHTEYGGLIQQLGNLPAFRAASGLSGKWFESKEEARIAALEWYKFELAHYKRECAGKNYAQQAIQKLT